MADYEISAEITADAKGFEEGIKTAQKSMQGFSSKLKDFTKSVSGGVLSGNLMYDGIKLITKGIKAGIDTVKKGVKEYEQFNKEQKLLAQTLKVTGAETWTTVESLNAYADALQETTNYSGGEISQLQTVLLGFKNITGENFNEATNAILDMASVMNMDLTSATQAVAKALDDPIKGINSLSRQGFIFTEQQKEQLATMVEVGDIASAQKVILEELATTYGGASQASAKATTQLKNNWKDVLQQVGRNVVIDFDIEPAVKKMNTMVKKWKESLQEMADAKEKSDRLIEAQEAERSGNATQEQRLLLLDEEKAKWKELEMLAREELEVTTDPERKVQLNKNIQYYSIEAGKIQANINNINKQIDAEKLRLDLEKEAMEKAIANAEEQEKNQNIIDKAIEKANEELQKQKLLWKTQTELSGEEISNEEKLEFYRQNLTNAIAETNGLINSENAFYKERLGIIKEIASVMSADDVPLPENKILPAIEKAREAIKKQELEWEAQEKITGKIVTNEEKIAFYQKNLGTAVVESDGELSRGEVFYDEQIGKIGELKNEQQQQNDKTVDWKVAIGKVGESFKKMQEVAKKVFKTIGDVAKKTFQGFKKLININLNDSMETLLKFEDKILTFFVETLPQLPSFLASAIESVFTLIETLTNSIDKGALKETITSIINTMLDYLPSLLTNIVSVVLELGSVIIDSILEFVKNGGVKTLVNSVMNAINMMLDFIIENIDDIADILIDGIVQIIESIIDNLPEVIGKLVTIAIKLTTVILTKLLPAIAEILIKLIKELPDVFKKIAEAVWDGIVDGIKSLGKGVKKVWGWIEDSLGFATGTNNAPRGLAVVGEQGPELIDFNGGERVYTASNTRALLSNGASGGNNFNVTFNNIQDTSAYTMMRQLKSYNRQMAINGVL